VPGRPRDVYLAAKAELSATPDSEILLFETDALVDSVDTIAELVA